MTTAQEVQANLSAHEKLCADRWEGIRDSVKSLWWVVLVSAGFLISGQAYLIVQLASHGALR